MKMDNKQPETNKDDTVFKHGSRKREVSNLSCFDVITEAKEESSEHVIKDNATATSTDFMTEKFSEASIRLEEKFECGFCSSLSVVGRCEQCLEYLCKKCLKPHDQVTVSGTHDVFFFRCSESLKVNKIVPATAYCQMCEEYLCDKCAIYHTGFRKFRRHFIVYGTEMPVLKPKLEPPQRQLATRTTKSKLNKATKAKSVSRLSFMDPIYQREPKLLWSKKKGYFFKWIKD